MLENFKLLPLITFDRKRNQYEYITTIYTQMAIIGDICSLKCKLIFGTLKEAKLRWYMNPLKFSLTVYWDILRKQIHQFSVSKHQKVSTTSMFMVLRGHYKSMRKYVTRFNEVTIKVVTINQDIFV